MAEAAPAPAPGRGGPRRTFGPATLVALGSGTLCAVAGTRAAVGIDADGQAAAMVAAGTAQGDALTMPLVTSLALVGLAAWGVLLVTRGRVRRGSAGLALLAGLGTLLAAVLALSDLRGTVDDALAQVGATGGASVTGWFVAAVVGALGLTAASGLAVRQVPAWPEMGQRYDAPTDTPSAGELRGEPGEVGSLDLWKAMDEGRDPTA